MFCVMNSGGLEGSASTGRSRARTAGRARAARAWCAAFGWALRHLRSVRSVVDRALSRLKCSQFASVMVELPNSTRVFLEAFGGGQLFHTLHDGLLATEHINAHMGA